MDAAVKRIVDVLRRTTAIHLGKVALGVIGVAVDGVSR
jgi:hypothetical protein